MTVRPLTLPIVGSMETDEYHETAVVEQLASESDCPHSDDVEEYVGPVVSVNTNDRDLHNSAKFLRYLARMVQLHPNNNEDFAQNLAEEAINFLSKTGWAK